ncbi:hypothetical protein [Pseudalkalibacillus decolorationis]|uniref:hypothetical protein n=1 Tax=Pseudalkalibacillus decolorationis TaxID=163879 RepID=UPI002149580C|nr:hypothetical protein [Pseudalkalibacillus decolorationis]
MKFSFITIMSLLLFLILTACGSSVPSIPVSLDGTGDRDSSYEIVTANQENKWIINNEGKEIGTIQYVDKGYFDNKIFGNFEGGLHQDEIMSDWHYENTRFVLEHVKSMEVLQRYYFIYPTNDKHSYILTSTTPTTGKEEIMKLAQSFRYEGIAGKIR